VTRVVTPGTLTEDELLDPRSTNHLVALAPLGARGPVGLAWVELSTGTFCAADVPRDRLADELHRLAPSECLVGEMAATAEASALLERLRESLGSLTVTHPPHPPWCPWRFGPPAGRRAPPGWSCPPAPSVPPMPPAPAWPTSCTAWPRRSASSARWPPPPRPRRSWSGCASRWGRSPSPTGP